MFTFLQDPLVNSMTSQISWDGAAALAADTAMDFAALVLMPEITAPIAEAQVHPTDVLPPKAVMDNSVQIFDLKKQNYENAMQAAAAEPEQLPPVPPVPDLPPLPRDVADKDVMPNARMPTNQGMHDKPGPDEVQGDSSVNPEEDTDYAPDQAVAAGSLATVVVAVPRQSVRDFVAEMVFVPMPAAPKSSEGVNPTFSPPRQAVHDAVPEGEKAIGPPGVGFDLPAVLDTVILRDPAMQSAPKQSAQAMSKGDPSRFGADSAAMPEIGDASSPPLPEDAGKAAAFVDAPAPARQPNDYNMERRPPHRDAQTLPEGKALPAILPGKGPSQTPKAWPGSEATKFHSHATEIVAIRVFSDVEDRLLPTVGVITDEIAPPPPQTTAEVPTSGKIAASHAPVEPVTARNVTFETEDAAIGMVDAISPEAPTKDPAPTDFELQPDLVQDRQTVAHVHLTGAATSPSVQPADLLQAAGAIGFADPAQPLKPAQVAPSDTVVQRQPSVVWQVAEAVVAKADSMAPGRIEITLAPETLGKVHFDMQSDKNGVSITLSAERPETLDLIRRNLPDLVAELKQAGIEGGTFHFGAWNGKSKSDGRDAPPRASPADFDPMLVKQGEQTVLRSMTGSAQLNIRL